MTFRILAILNMYNVVGKRGNVIRNSTNDGLTFDDIPVNTIINRCVGSD